MSARTAATREKLFAAAMELIGQRGAGAVTVDEIAAAAGVAKGTVYYNFGSKNELVEQLLRHGMGVLMGALRGSAAAQERADDGGGPAGADPFAEVAGMVGRALGFIGEHPAFVRLWMGEQWRADGTWQSVLTQMRAEVLTEIRGALSRLAERVPLRPGQDIHSLSVALFGAAFLVGMDRVARTEHGVGGEAGPLTADISAVTAGVVGAFQHH